jgi:chemotaxis protein CheD
MNPLVVGVADARVSNDPGLVLATYALGSCVAIAAYDPAARVAGLLHFMLPDSGIDGEKAHRNPWMFADTGIPLLLRAAYDMGADRRRLVVRAAGAANVMDDGGLFQIGRRNEAAMRRYLSIAGVMLREEAIGGAVSRSVFLEVATGAFRVRTAGEIDA